MRNSADIARLCAMTAAFVVVCAALTQAPGCAKKSKAVVTGCSLGSHCPTTGTCYVPTGQCVARCDTYATCNNPSHEQCIFASGLEPQCVPSEEVEIDPRFHSEDANGPDTSGEDVSKDLIFGTEDSGGEDRVGGEDAVTSDTGDPDLVASDTLELDGAPDDLVDGDDVSLVDGDDVSPLDSVDAQTVDGLGPDSSDDDGTFDLTGDATVDLVDEEVSTTPRISCSSYLAHWLVGQPKQHTYRYTGPNLGPSPAISLEGGPASLGASIVEELDGSYSITVHDVCDQPHYGPVVFKIGGQTLTADVSGDPCVIICDRPLASIKDPPPEHTRYHEIPQSGAVDLKTYHNVTALTGLVPQSYSVEESLGYNLLELQSGAAQQFGIDKLVSIGADGTMTIGALEFPGSLGFTILVQSQVTITISGSVQQVSYSRGTLEIGFAVSDVGNPVGDPVTSNLVGYGGFSIGSTALLVPPQLTSSSTTDLALEIGPADWQGPGAPCPDAGTICWCISYNYQVRFSCIPPAELAITSNECEPGCGQNQVCLKEADGAICRGYDPAQSDPANSVYHLTFNNTTVTAALHDNGFSPTSTPGTVNDPFETNLVDGLSFNTFVLPSASPWCWVWYKYSFYSSAYVSYPCGAPQIGSKAPQYTSIMSFVISGP